MTDTQANYVQFCRGGDDITADFHRETDATEVRVWNADGVILAVRRSGRDDTWSYAASDFGPDPSWDTTLTFRNWQEALETYGYGELTEC